MFLEPSDIPRTSIQHGHLHHSSVTTSRMTYFILQANSNLSYPHPTQEKLGRGFRKEDERIRKVDFRKDAIPGRRPSMQGYILTLQVLKGEPLSSGFSTTGCFTSASAEPHYGELTGEEGCPVITKWYNFFLIGRRMALSVHGITYFRH